MNMKKETMGTLFALATAIISGFSIIVNKFFVASIDPTVFTAVRAFIIGLVFLIIAFYRKDFSKGVKKINWPVMLLIGFIGGAVAFLLFFTGLGLTTGGRAAFLHKTLPLYTTLLAFLFLKERITKKQAGALVLMFLGTVAIYCTKINPAELWSNPSLGDKLIIAATFLWAVENTLARGIMIKKESNYIVTFSRMFFGSIFLFLAVFYFGKADILFTLSHEQIIKIVVSTLFLFGYVFCWYNSIKLINVSKASTLLLLAPVVSLILGVAVFGEPAPAMQLAGSAMILLGAFLVSRTKSEFVSGI